MDLIINRVNGGKWLWEKTGVYQDAIVFNSEEHKGSWRHDFDKLPFKEGDYVELFSSELRNKEIAHREDELAEIVFVRYGDGGHHGEPSKYGILRFYFDHENYV